MLAHVTRNVAFTCGRHVSEALVLTPFPLAVADVKVDVGWRGEMLVAVRRDFHQEHVLKDKDRVLGTAPWKVKKKKKQGSNIK